MTIVQRLLYLYGFYRAPRADLQSTANAALSAFQNARREMENVYRQFETVFERRSQALENAERKLGALHQEIQQQNERLSALSRLTPDAAHQVNMAIEKAADQH